LRSLQLRKSNNQMKRLTTFGFSSSVGHRAANFPERCPSPFNERILFPCVSNVLDSRFWWAMAGRSAEKLEAVRDEVGVSKGIPETALTKRKQTDRQSVERWVFVL
jgi:hypothetical protein